MASQRDDDVTPHLEMSKKWKKAFEEIFFVFSPDKWKLGPTDTDMPKGWQQFKDSAKVKFLCKSCDNSWTSMAGRIIFWFKKIEESERKEETKTTTEAVKEDGEDSSGASVKDTKNPPVCTYMLLVHFIFHTSVFYTGFAVLVLVKRIVASALRVKLNCPSGKDMLICVLVI